MMKKTISTLCLLLLSLTMFGQTFTSLWKQVNDAAEKDLPKTQQEVLGQIVKKAEKEKAYGQLLKASLMHARVQVMVNPDSLAPAVERLKIQAEATKDIPLQAVYFAVLGQIYRNNTKNLSEDWKAISDDYNQKALAHPAQLAAVQVDAYEPFVVKGKDSYIYNNDLLSLIGHETMLYKPMHDYYMTTDNRRAQLMSALYLLDEPDDFSKEARAAYLHSLDSLTEIYGDLPECGEVAIERYNYMDGRSEYTAEQKISYIDRALSRWGAWKRMNELRNARNELTLRQFYATIKHRVWIPNREQDLILTELRGVDKVTIKVYKVKADGDIQLDPNDKDDFKKLKPLLTALPALTQTRTYSGKKEYELYKDSLKLNGLPVGVYMMEVETQPTTDVSRSLFFVSDVRVMMQALPHNHDNQLRYVVVNATTGKPIAGAKLRLMTRRGIGTDKLAATLTTDHSGEAVYYCKNQERPNYAFATTADDRACPETNVYGNFNYYDNSRTINQVAIYTDRAIYRPGQIVHVSAILYSVQNGYEHEVSAGKQTKVLLRDANYKIVEEKQLTTDDFGTLSTQFTLPSTALTGRFTIQIENNSHPIRVEEYKRPTFHVEFPKVEQDYKEGDTLTVKATTRTYAGVPVQDARVRYKVERRVAFWWFSYYRYWQTISIIENTRSEEVFSGEVLTDENGTFEVKMPMVLPDSKNPMFFNFVVVADVTDQAGETHQGQLSLPLGNRESALTIDLPEKMLAEDMPQMKLHLLNVAGNDVSATIRYQIDGGKWKSVASNTAIDLPKLKSGKHQLNVEYEEKKAEREFVVFSLDDKRPATETDDWFYCSDEQFPYDGTPVTLQIGSSEDVHIVYTIVAGSTIIEKGAVDKKNELVNRKLTYKPEYGNGLALSFAWIRDGKVHRHETQIKHPLPNKQLTLKWESFRDRLTPGQQEEWTLRITENGEQKKENADKSQVSKLQSQIQFMATLYDKSLDQITAHNWSLRPYIWLSLPSLYWRASDWGSAGIGNQEERERLDVNSLNFNTFNKECFPLYWISRNTKLRRTGGGLLTKAVRSADIGAAEETMVFREVAVSAQKATVADTKEFNGMAMAPVDESLQDRIAGLDIVGDDKAGEQQVQMRENLQETAFFYPQLLADSTGRISMKFTLPESLTTWRFLGIAHTKDMMYGSIEGEVVAQKDVMIQPNVPRFLRMGDEANISARIFNMTDRELGGTARLILSDPESENIIYKASVTCTLKEHGTQSVTFRIPKNILEGQSLLVCKMSISGETFSDGEQHYLPILPNRERVTVTVPITQTEPSTKTINLESLFPQTSSHSSLSPKLTIEYTNNPAWLMIQALPTIGHAYDKCAMCQATAYYANSIGQYILDQNPTAKHVFEMWKREDSSLSTLQSSLQKNEELKDLVLNETPWVMDADNEAEQKQRLGDFFDKNLMESRLSTSAELLKKLQNGDGSWSWWPGMDGSFFMTVEISEMLVRLNQMTTPSQASSLKPQIDQAFSFMDKEILELVNEMKKQEKKGIKQTFPSHKALQYLYIYTLDGRKPSIKVSEAQNYLKKLLKKEGRNLSIYDKAMACIVLNSGLFLKSLHEWSTYKEGMGRYYDTPRADYSWRDYRIPTQVAVIEAYQRLLPSDQKCIRELQQWLLQEKHTQAWDTPVNSVNAIYAFLNGNEQALAPQPKTQLKIDGQPLETSEATAAIGYVKTALPAEGKKEFTAEKTSTGTSWGAVYAQFMQDTKDIQDQSSEISVKREVLTAHSSPLKVGQRIKVRLTIEAQRDLDFVEVIDRRAACMEPINQLSGYHYGYYCAPKDNATHFFFDVLRKGKHVIETEYYIDRAGTYETGTCTVQCAYAPEFRGTTHSLTLKIEE